MAGKPVLPRARSGVERFAYSLSPHAAPAVAASSQVGKLRLRRDNDASQTRGAAKPCIGNQLSARGSKNSHPRPPAKGNSPSREIFDPDHLSGKQGLAVGQVRRRRKGAEGRGEPWAGCRGQVGCSQHGCGEPETAGWVRALGGKLRDPGRIWGSPESLGSPSGHCRDHRSTAGRPCDMARIQRSLTRPHGSRLLHRQPVPCRPTGRLSEASR